MSSQSTPLRAVDATGTTLAVGDRVRMDGTPFTVTVAAVQPCAEPGCDQPVIAFADPSSGELDTAHADAFTHL